MIAMLLRVMFYRAPKLDYTEDEKRIYDRLYDQAVREGHAIPYDCDYPKQRFIRYISDTRDVLLHGSNNKTIETFVPRKQTLYNGRLTTAVFATKDGIWPVFYAVFDRTQLAHNFRNGGLRTGSGDSFHYYSLDSVTSGRSPWTPGAVYFLPRESFVPMRKGIVAFDEWTSPTAVKPLTKLHVEPADFVYLDQVAEHRHDESIVWTWLLYKSRLRRGRRTSAD